MRARYRVRRAANAVNGSTLTGVGIAALGRARLGGARNGLLVATGYRLPVPAAPAFCVGNVIVTRLAGIDSDSALFRHEARHATQFACCGGVVMIPAYFAAALWSWTVTGDFGSRNVFERRAGLADGGYSSKPARIARRRTRPGTSRTLRMARQVLPVSRNSPSAGSAAMPFITAWS